MTGYIPCKSTILGPPTDVNSAPGTRGWWCDEPGSEKLRRFSVDMIFELDLRSETLSNIWHGFRTCKGNEDNEWTVYGIEDEMCLLVQVDCWSKWACGVERATPRRQLGATSVHFHVPRHRHRSVSRDGRQEKRSGSRTFCYVSEQNQQEASNGGRGPPRDVADGERGYSAKTQLVSNAL